MTLFPVNFDQSEFVHNPDSSTMNRPLKANQFFSGNTNA